MDRIKSFGHFAICHWFTREDGARFIKIEVPYIILFIHSRGLGMDQVNAHHIVGYYHNINTNNSFGLILHEEGTSYEEHHFLGFAEPSDRFERWMASLIGLK